MELDARRSRSGNETGRVSLPKTPKTHAAPGP